MRYPLLTSPVTIGNLYLKNRMVMSPMATYGMANEDGSPSERHRAYYEARARSGLGLIRLEATLVHLSGKSWPCHLALYDDRYTAGMAELARTIKRHGAAAIVQLHHGGRVALPELSGGPPLAPSPLPAAGRLDVPKELARDGIEELVEAFASAAQRAREAGFDGVELHMGTNYLLLSFVSPAQNVRQDEYGGDFAGRMRFPLRIIARIQQLAGRDYPIGARIVASDYYDGGVDLAYCQQVAATLADAGLAYVDVSTGMGPNELRESPLAMGHGEGVFADYAAAVKSVVSIPVMTVGRYYSLQTAEAVLAAGKADLVVFGRALLADPELVAKSVRGQERHVIPCIGCEACLAVGYAGLGTSCLLNPATGHEHELRLEPAAQSRRLLVLGSGVPGLELARVAALRGHEVTVATCELPFGGLLALRAELPSAREIDRAIQYFRRTLAELGVRVVEHPPEGPFDLLVDARPGSPILPSVPGLAPGALLAAEEVLASPLRAQALGRRVAVLGPGIYAAEAALYLAAAGKQVTLLCVGESLQEHVHTRISGRTALRFATLGGQTVSGAMLLSAEADCLTLELEGQRQTVGPFDQVVAAIGWYPPTPPPDGNGYVLPDAWDASAALLRAYEATSLARRI